jgi:hypothetical protein
MARARAAFDRGGVQPVDAELMADFLQHPEFALRQRAIGHRHIARQRIGGFVKPLGQGVADQAEQGVQPVLLFQQVKDGCAMLP